MKRSVLLLSVLALAVGGFAQSKKKGTTQRPVAQAAAPAAVRSQTSAPQIASDEVLFQGFTSSFVRFGPMSAGFRPFTVKVEYSPWLFEFSGKVNAGHNTADLDIYTDEVVAVVAYFDALGASGSGEEYQAGLFDVMLYFEDEPTRIEEVRVKLLGSASEGGSASLNRAKEMGGESGSVFKDSKNSRNIVMALAGALDQSAVAAARKVEKKRQADSVATYRAEQKRLAEEEKLAERRERKRQADSVAAFDAEQKRLERASIARERREQRRQDSIAAVEERATAARERREQRRQDSIAAAQARQERAAAAREKRAQARQQVQASDDEQEDSRPRRVRRPAVEETDDESTPAVRKKRVRRPAVEETEEEAPVVRKKRVRRPVAEETEEE